MSEDNEKKNDDNADDAATLKAKLEAANREKAALEIKLRRSDEDLYSEEYLAFLQQQKEKQPPQNSFMSGGRLSDYSDEELQNLPISKLVTGIAGEVLNVIRTEEQSKMTKEERVAHKKKVANTRIEITKFAKEHPDFWNYVARIDELTDENPNLNTEQLYVLAGGKLEEKKPPEKKEEPKKETPNTRPGGEAGMKKSDKNLSRREIIQQEYQKLK